MPALRLGARAACACAVMALLAGGCGGESDRDRMQSYLKDANGIQRRAAPAFRRSNDVYQRFATNKIKPAQAARRLARAERAIRATRLRLARLHPPRQAAALHTKLLHVYDLNVGLAHETTALARYLPAAAAAGSEDQPPARARVESRGRPGRAGPSPRPLRGRTQEAHQAAEAAAPAAGARRK